MVGTPGRHTLRFVIALLTIACSSELLLSAPVLADTYEQGGGMEGSVYYYGTPPPMSLRLLLHRHDRRRGGWRSARGSER